MGHSDGKSQPLAPLSTEGVRGRGAEAVLAIRAGLGQLWGRGSVGRPRQPGELHPGALLQGRTHVGGRREAAAAGPPSWTRWPPGQAGSVPAASRPFPRDSWGPPCWVLPWALLPVGLWPLLGEGTPALWACVSGGLASSFLRRARVSIVLHPQTASVRPSAGPLTLPLALPGVGCPEPVCAESPQPAGAPGGAAL